MTKFKVMLRSHAVGSAATKTAPSTDITATLLVLSPSPEAAESEARFTLLDHAPSWEEAEQDAATDFCVQEVEELSEWPEGSLRPLAQILYHAPQGGRGKARV
jgi:hypothetical protein